VTPRQGTIAVAGAIAQRPGRGGHAWVFLQYLIGLKRLGWDVLFIDRLQPGTCSDAAYVDGIMRQFGFGGDYSVLDPGGGAFGLTRTQVARRLQGCALLLNFMGYLDDAELLALPNRRVFFDIDPGFTQMWQALGLAEMLAGHDVFVTVAENIGSPACTIPTCDVRWITTPPPVVLDQWPWADSEATSITGIGSWRGPYGNVIYDGLEYGLRVHEFRKFAILPGQFGGPSFQYALDIDPVEVKEIGLLTNGGWQLLDPVSVAGTPDAYRDFVQRSIAEFMVAKSIYVKSRSGWFSDRSACYLASGRPVIAQDTGGTHTHPEGLLTFTTEEEAIDTVRRVLGNYARHRRAAREIAEETYDSDRVLSRLVNTMLAA
jgi:hypothetical protein